MISAVSGMRKKIKEIELWYLERFGTILSSDKRLSWLIVALLLFSAAFFNTAWVADDAFITFRVIDNALNGYGLTWNPGERVQVYTHPLWFGVQLGLVAVFGDPYFVCLAISYLLLCFTIFLLFTLPKELTWGSLAVIFSLLLSRSFVDYSSSGLENPLTHFLVAAYVWVWFKFEGRCRAYLLFSLGSALFLCRPDSLLLVIPSLLSLVYNSRSIMPALIGGLPVACWVCFSVFYYGAPIPNTALAKVGTGTTFLGAVEQAWAGLSWMYRHDTFSLFLLLFGGCAAWINQRGRVFFFGLLLWLIFYFYVGGDYMGGRFFSTPILLAACMVLFFLRPFKAILFTPFVFLSVGALGNTLISPLSFNSQTISENGIADERAFYYQGTGLKPALINKGVVHHPWLVEGQLLSGQQGFFVRCSIGMVGFGAGPAIHWIDPLALADPLLARLPARSNARVGHFERAFPEGYLESIVLGENRLAGSRLKALFDDVQLATTASLFAEGRAAAIWRLNSGFHSQVEVEFNKEKIGLPGVPVQNNAKPSCLGIQHGGAINWKLSEPPVVGMRIVFR
ncbi:hypothetical protein [Microbulbifer aggregans]|uniref:hypothetical protein n=1 Tax=Microbulbifer aggregans TaxID=1769779 RepID=UPI001CFEB37C|nr:hypothetical protein [Microbulbifer aggregans]